MTKLQSVGVIGAGAMGNGIAHVCALGGHDVALVDLSDEILATAVERISYNMERQVAKGLITEAERVAGLKRLTTSTSYDIFNQTDLVIEAATEDEAIKRAIFKDLCPYLKPEAMIATNTSSISITRLAAGTDRPGRFMGMHFM
ncbi:MAG: 3-hydroxyacyl-CoA dehydrogenase NAD-binding domain-containing protein, partial [Rhodospirillales bacterium]